MAWLREAHGILANLLEKDESNLEEANKNTYLVETVLRATNPKEDWSYRFPTNRAADTINSSHPILGRLNIPLA
jgi:hypothetical protein